MIAVVGAWARGFARDLPGVALTLLLPPLVFLMFSAIFGAGARGEIDSAVALHDGVGSASARAVVERALEGRVRIMDDAAAARTAVVDGRADAGVLIRPGPDGRPVLEVIAAADRTVAATALQARLEPVAAALAGVAAPPRPAVVRTEVGPEGDVQSAYYAGAVGVMFVFFAAMHGAMQGLDERRSGLQARMALAGGGLAPILAGRAVWLTAVGMMQSAAVFAAAWTRLPPLEPWQIGAVALTAALVGLAAAGLGLGLIGLCRSRDQAQPLTTFVVLLLAALGGSMAPRFLMPEAFRHLGWITPHAWAIEAYGAVIWRGALSPTVVAAWAVLAGVGLVGLAAAWIVETRRAAR